MGEKSDNRCNTKFGSTSMKKSICLGIIAGALLYLYGCATVTLNTSCPASSTGVSFALSGSTVGNQLISMLGAAATKGGFMAGAGTAPTPTSGTMTYTYIPIFGADSGSLSCTQPPQGVGVFSPGPPPSIVH